MKMTMKAIVEIVCLTGFTSNSHSGIVCVSMIYSGNEDDINDRGAHVDVNDDDGIGRVGWIGYLATALWSSVDAYKSARSINDTYKE